MSTRFPIRVLEEDGVQSGDRVESCLDSDGNLVVDVEIQVCVEKKSIWYPKVMDIAAPPGKYLLESPVGTDIHFSVGEEQVKFPTHKHILFHRAPSLYDFIKDVPKDQDFEIPDVAASTFKVLLEYIYAGTVPEFQKQDCDEEVGVDDEGAVNFASCLLSAADRFGLVYLKLFVESEIVAKILKIGNASDWLLIADSRTCPLLKEACMWLFVTNKSEFKASQGWKHVQESATLLEELLDYSIEGIKAVSSVDDYQMMSVQVLREKLESKKLDLDGSKQTLIQRLKNHNDDDEEDEE